ncbi:MAG: aldo/keto reductase [Thomasclavelia sp.]
MKLRYLIIVICIGTVILALWQNQNSKGNEVKMAENNLNDYVFDLDNKTVTLNDGNLMPINGIGTYSLTDEVCYNSIISALDSGVRLIDTAYMYHNEEDIGRAIKDSKVAREDIFITTKLYPNQYANPEAAIDLALEKLDVDYIDLMLLHHPGDNDVKAYLAMEKAVSEGKIHSIGLSNWYIEELEEFLPQVNITPALVQNEIHPYYQENDVIPYIQELGIVVEGWYPFGGRGYTSELLNNEVIQAIANNHNVSTAQVILRWNLQREVVVIPGSSNSEHIYENTQIYHFSLTDEEMEQLKSLDRKEKHDWY